MWGVQLATFHYLALQTQYCNVTLYRAFASCSRIARVADRVGPGLANWKGVFSRFDVFWEIGPAVIMPLSDGAFAAA